MKIDWIPTKKKLPKMKLHMNGLFKEYMSEKVLVQTSRGEFFSAYLYSLGNEKDWYTHGTGGRKMRIMNKVIAWSELPERYVENDK